MFGLEIIVVALLLCDNVNSETDIVIAHRNEWKNEPVVVIDGSVLHLM